MHQTTYRKRVTIMTSEKSEPSIDDQQSTGGMLSSRIRGGAVYRKKISNVEGGSAIDGVTSSDRGAATMSEKSYDSESDIDIRYIEELEQHEQEEEEKRRTEAAKDLAPAADGGNAFLQDLLERNFDDADDEPEKNGAKEGGGGRKSSKAASEQGDDIDMIHLVEESEHKFIRYAQ